MIAPPDLTVDQLAAIEAAGWIYRGSNSNSGCISNT